MLAGEAVDFSGRLIRTYCTNVSQGQYRYIDPASGKGTHWMSSFLFSFTIPDLPVFP